MLGFVSLLMDISSEIIHSLLAVFMVLATMVADTAPEDLRDTSFGFFNLARALALLIASALADLLWDRLSSLHVLCRRGSLYGDPCADLCRSA